MSAKRTPLYEKHVALGGNVVDYAGWELPVQYEGLKPEHFAVREAVGIFDVSHMGEVTVKGKDALKFVNYLMANDISSIGDNQVIYTFMCNEKGGTVDDLLVYRKAENDLYLVVNAANSDKDFEWMQNHKEGFDVELENISAKTGQIAIQGPKAEEVLQKLTDHDLSSIKFFHFAEDVPMVNSKFLVSRTGYTGEDGFEVYGTPEAIVKLWDACLENGKEEGIKPCGLGCRDTLRFEAGLPLYGNEMNDEIGPLEASLGYFVKVNKDSDFIGKDVLKEQKEGALKRKTIGLELKGKGIPRHGYKVMKDGKEIGFITTGYLSPTLDKCIANVMVDIDEAKIGNEVEVMIRNKSVPAVLISKRFLQKK